jgi:hypothetical protein
MRSAATSNAVAVDGAPRTDEVETDMASEGTAAGQPVIRHGRGGGWLVWLAVVVALIAGGVVGGTIVATNRSSATPIAATSADVCSATAVGEKNLPSVVTISATDGRAGGTESR